MTDNPSSERGSRRNALISRSLAFARTLADSERKSALLAREVELRDEELAQLRSALARAGKDADERAVGMAEQVAMLERRCNEIQLGLRSARRRLTMMDEYRDGRGESRSYRAASTRKSGSSVMRIAAIVDEFTFDSLSPSCEMLRVPLSDWDVELQSFSPDLLFVESAWLGNGGVWRNKINRASKELMTLVRWCRTKNVPTVFWNKEDPVHFEVFINTARAFDFVFTTDIECIGRYKAFLRHDRVHLLPFWGQLAVNNPIEQFPREKGFCFAGASYARYPDRQRDLEMFVDTLATEYRFDIYDRNHGMVDSGFDFPEEYHRLIRGGLPHSEIARAYKGYEFGINLNSVKKSQSMYARRVFDLLLSNTHVVSNYSRGLRLMFGDLVTSTDQPETLLARVRPLMKDEALVSRYRHLRLEALRKTILEHTAEDRLVHVAKVLGLRTEGRKLPNVLAAAIVDNDARLESVLASYSRQNWPNKKLVLVLSPGYLPSEDKLSKVRRPGVEILVKHDANEFHPASVEEDAHVAILHPDDYYGEHYFTDLALGTLYAGTEAVGKASRYELENGELRLIGNGRQYKATEWLEFRSALVAARALASVSLWELLQGHDDRRVCGLRCMALDEFSYVLNGGGEAPEGLDMPLLDTGIPIQVLYTSADGIHGSIDLDDFEQCLDAKTLSTIFSKVGDSGRLRLTLRGGILNLKSTLEDGEHKYLYASRSLQLADLLVLDDGELVFNLMATPGLNLDMVFLFLDENGERIHAVVKPFGRNHREKVPVGTHSVLPGFRVSGGGMAQITALSLREVGYTSRAVELGRSEVLVLTNVYPSHGDLYRNAFVHRRVQAYRQQGIYCDVYCLNSKASTASYEFDDVDVHVGNAERLDALLSSGRYKVVLVHFLDPMMWQILRKRIGSLKTIVWLHGAEVQPWQRRDFNYVSESERQEAIEKSDARIRFWQGVMSLRHPNVSYVFVSEYFAEEVMSDVGVRLDPSQYCIIHNFIDDELFNYVEKDPAQRFKLLSIRPFASRKYANDLTVQAILALRADPRFPSLEIRIVGDGPMFEEVLSPLCGLSNVALDRRFLTQKDIAGLHKEYGIFLCPTRMDSQGVSRDEAMASGLVPVTNEVAAIPEFVDGSCGILAPAEDWQAMADGISRVLDDPELFSRLSCCAAARVRDLSGFSRTVEREVGLVRPLLRSVSEDINN